MSVPGGQWGWRERKTDIFFKGNQTFNSLNREHACSVSLFVLLAIFASAWQYGKSVMGSLSCHLGLHYWNLCFCSMAWLVDHFPGFGTEEGEGKESLTQTVCSFRSLGCHLGACVCALSCSAVSNSLWPRGLQPTMLLCLWHSPGKNTRVGWHFLLQGVFWTQG